MKRLALIYGAAALLLSACNKKQDVVCLAGLGGDLVVRVVPLQNGTAVVSTNDDPVEVYIAFGQIDFPGTEVNQYQKSVSGKNNNAYVMCHNLKCGMYYFYAVYTDPGTGDTWAGGAPMSTQQQSGEVELKVALTKE
jgi:hypothetical protein